MVRVRFAPSPTGPLHIGGVRTALFNFLFAKKLNGKYILRIEDTDSQRFVKGAEEYIINSLNWCGITFDEGPHIGGDYGPYRQSERKDIYIQYALQLIKDKRAYYAFDTPEELEQHRASDPAFQYGITSRLKMKNSLTLSEEEVQKRISSGEPYVIRIMIPEQEQIIVDDIIRGKVVFESEQLDDKVIFKSSDSLPTYHLANIVDDHLMKITHVIRGEEWLPSAPMHVLLYKYLNWQPPQFAHVPLILKPQGSGKLSKRDGDKMGFPVFPMQWKDPQTGDISLGYREWGYLPQAFINMLVMLGWNPGNIQEIFTIEELISEFSIEKVQKSGAKFDPEKTKWFNHQYILQAENEELVKYFHEILIEQNINAPKQLIIEISGLIKDRLNLLTEFWEHASYFFIAPTEYDEALLKKHITPETPVWIEKIKANIKSIDNWQSAIIEEKIKNCIQENSYPMGKIFNILRLAMVGKNHGIGIADIIHILGKEETINRIDKLLKYTSNGHI